MNISTRLGVGDADNVLIGGFIVQGIAPKKVIVRGIGPSLAAAHVGGPLADPILELHDNSGAIIAENDNWRSAQEQEIIASTIAPTDDQESAIVATLAPGPYTAIVRSADGNAGVGLVEVYDLETAGSSRLVNISTRGSVGSSENVMIGGFIVQTHKRKMVIRAIGPSLATAGVTNPVGDPKLEIFSGRESFASNDNWANGSETDILATFGLTPTSSREAAVVVDLEPGAYTAVISGAGGGTGVALVEAYDISVNPTGVSAFSIPDPNSSVTDFVFGNTSGSAMAIEGTKNPDGSVTHVDRVVLTDSKLDISNLVSFNDQGLVSAIQSSNGENIVLSHYDLVNLTATLSYIDASQGTLIGPVTVSIPADSDTLRQYVLAGQFAPSSAVLKGFHAESAVISKPFWESRIGKLIGGAIGTAAVILEENPSSLLKSGLELVTSVYDLGEGITGVTAPYVIGVISPYVDAASCISAFAFGVETGGAYLPIAAASISCSKTVSQVVERLVTEPSTPMPGQLAFSSPEIVATEGVGSATFNVERLGGSSGQVSATVFLGHLSRFCRVE